MKSVLLLVPFSMAILQPFSANAADVETAVTIMDEVVVTATKTEEKRKDIVNSMVVKDAIDIAEAPAQSLGALLANEAGIDWRTRGNYGGAAESIQIRGMGADGTQVVRDGVVLNSPSLGSADISQIPLNSIERVEVVKGPGSLLYGSGAMGGTVNVISKRPKRDGYVAKVEAGYGTENTYNVAAESGGFVAGDFGYYLTANRKETDGFRDNSDLTHNDVTLNMLLDKGDRFQSSVDFSYIDREYGLPGVQPPAGTNPYAIGGLEFYNGDSATLLDRGEDENYYSALTLKGQETEWVNWRLKGDYAKLESANYSRYSYDGSGSETTVTNTVTGVEGNLDLHPFSRLGVLLGNEYRNFDYENEQQSLDTTGARIAGGVLDQNHRIFTNGTFAEASFRPVEPVQLVGGYRYETHSLFGHEDVIRYGLVVTPLPDTAIKFNSGQHFKAPTLNDLFWPDDGFTKGNPDLKPETGWHSDVTVEQGLLDGKLFASLSWFQWDITDKIDWAEDPTQPSPTGWGNYWTPANVDTYQATGWEANVKIGPYYAVQADLSLTLLDAEEELTPGVTRPARYSPDTQFKCQLSHFSEFGLISALTARYTSSRPGYYASKTDRNAEIELASYWTVDLKLEQELGAHWKIAFLATNLLDKEYDTYLAGFSDQTTSAYTQQPYPGAGRSLFASLAYNW
jgi:outer membrane cobalamin receptor